MESEGSEDELEMPREVDGENFVGFADADHQDRGDIDEMSNDSITDDDDDEDYNMPNDEYSYIGNDSESYDDNDDDDDESDNNIDNSDHTRNPTTTNANGEKEQVDEQEEEDDVIKKILANSKAPRTHPPDINIDDFVVDLSFHPDQDILAVANMVGDAHIYRYSVDENKLEKTLELHTKAIRDIEFSLDGNTLFSASKDRSIALTDLETQKFKRIYDNAHEQYISRMLVVSEHMIASGDDDGTIKMWDTRDRQSNPIFSLKEVDDYITSMLTNDAQKILVATSGDGFLTAISIGSRKLYVQSEPYDEELTCMGLFRNDSKLIVGTSKGRLYTYNWNEFGFHSNMYPGPKTPMSHMIPVTDRVAVVAGEEGVLRALHCIPGRNLGIVGQHSLAVDAMDINHSGEYIASSSDNNDIKFWNIKYFEDIDDIKFNEKQNKFKEQKHNLPSSKVQNPGDFFSDLL